MVELEGVVTGVEGNAALLKSNISRLPPFPCVDLRVTIKTEDARTMLTHDPRCQTPQNRTATSVEVDNGFVTSNQDWDIEHVVIANSKRIVCVIQI